MLITEIGIEGKAAKTHINLCDDEREYFHVEVVPHNIRVKKWDRYINVDVSDEEIMKWAKEVQYRTDGTHGSDDVIQAYYREMLRFRIGR